jgi:hypothetical protein
MGVERERERERAGWGGGGRESKVSARSAPWSKSRHQMLGKTPLTKKAQEKSFTSTEQSLMAGPNCQAGRGKMVQQWTWARRGFYRRGRVRKLAHAR